MQKSEPVDKGNAEASTVTNILIVDDHEIIRSGLKIFIKKIIADAIVDEAWNEKTTLKQIRLNEYDIIILDISMPDTDPFALVTKILDERTEAKILFFSMHDEEVYAKRFLSLGAKGYISKTAPPEELSTAIHKVLKNERYTSNSLKGILAEEALTNTTGNPFNSLSKREFEIVQHFIKGESSSTVANFFSLKSSTIATYKKRIFEKLNCKNIIEVVQLAKVYNVIPSS